MKTKTKKAEIQTFRIADQDICVYKGTAYLVEQRYLEQAIKDGADEEHYRLEDYQQAKVGDIKKLVAALKDLEKAQEILNKIGKVVEGTDLFGEQVRIDEDGDLNVGCTIVNLKEARAFAAKL